ncbi:MAG: glycosyltransferase, partial [Prevotella sp.]|nr:glycosyltransferase [Prevotella sp.]
MPGYIFLYYEDKADISLLHSVQGVIRCLSSIVNQPYENMEIILADDASCDGSQAVEEEYAET